MSGADIILGNVLWAERYACIVPLPADLNKINVATNVTAQVSVWMQASRKAVRFHEIP